MTIPIALIYVFIPQGDVFQLDANTGTLAGMIEMLLQSAQGSINLLPALPAKWGTGHVHGLKARGGITVSMWWAGGTLQKAVFLSSSKQTINVVVAGVPDTEMKLSRDGQAPHRQLYHASEGTRVTLHANSPTELAANSPTLHAYAGVADMHRARAEQRRQSPGGSNADRARTFLRPGIDRESCPRPKLPPAGAGRCPAPKTQTKTKTVCTFEEDTDYRGGDIRNLYTDDKVGELRARAFACLYHTDRGQPTHDALSGL